jgi:hypothetical protein
MFCYYFAPALMCAGTKLFGILGKEPFGILRELMTAWPGNTAALASHYFNELAFGLFGTGIITEHSQLFFIEPVNSLHFDGIFALRLHSGCNTSRQTVFSRIFINAFA